MQALTGIKVVDISQVAAAPMCARHLADFGARVIHVEPPGVGDVWRNNAAGTGRRPSGEPPDINHNWENYNRNKQSLAVDFSREEGRQIIYRLVEKADVLVTNLLLYQREKYGLAYGQLKTSHPGLVYGSLTGFGRKGPDKNIRAYDYNSYWSRAGVSHMFSRPGLGGSVFRTAFGDNMAAMCLAFGIMTALYVRERTGIGQEVDVSLFQAGTYQLSFDTARALITGKDREDRTNLAAPLAELYAQAEQGIGRIIAYYRQSMRAPLAVPYRTQDDREISFNPGRTKDYWPHLCRALQREDLENDPRFETPEKRAQHHGDLVGILEGIIRSKPFSEWRTRFGEAGISVTVFQSPVDVVTDPQARANDFFVPFDHPDYGSIELLASPVTLSETPADIRMPAPKLGQHTADILFELGYSEDDIQRLKQQGTIG